MLEDIGIQALTVHCRLRNQGNKGEADWAWVKRIKDAGVQMPIILNGNIKTPEDVKFVFDTYECDAVMIGQAAITNPWIFNQSHYYMKYGVLPDEPTVEEKVNICIEHLRLAVDLKGERLGTREFRKHYSGYLRNIKDVSKLRMDLMGFEEFEPIEKKLVAFREEQMLLTE